MSTSVLPRIALLWLGFHLWSGGKVLAQQTPATTRPHPTTYTLTLADNKSTPLVTAHWAQMQDSSMNLHKREKYRAYYTVKVAKPSFRYPVETYRVFLPSKSVAIGETWQLPFQDPRLLQFLKQFDSRATTRLHNGGPDGAVAAIRAVPKHYIDVRFRIHAEYVMAPGRVYYTPAQFRGTLLLDRRTKSVVAFHCAVPTRTLNVDLNADRNIEIVHVPRMELVGGHHDLHKQIAWQHKIAASTLYKSFRRAFYPFEDIHWQKLTAGVALARKQNRPIHLIVLFGMLDDQSC